MLLKPWRQLASLVIAGAGGLCQVKGERCTTWATCVDHIVAVAEGGDFWDRRNLRASCWHCNASLGAAVGNRRKARYPALRF